MSGEKPRPVGGVDYPRNWHEFEAWFRDEGACRAYLEMLRWPDGFICPSCGGQKGWRRSRGLFQCAACAHEASVTAGTIFAGTRTPLRTWFAAAWYATNQKHGVSALGLKRVLGFGSYQTAWAMLHKLRRAMVRPGRDRLSGDVEADETYVGGHEPGAGGRHAGKKAIVAIAVEVPEERAIGRVRMARIPDVSGPAITGFIEEAVEPGSVVMTDGWRSYRGLPKRGYVHKPTSISASGDPAHVVMPGVHRVASLLKRWLLGTHQGAVRPQHLDYYLDEFTFRFNRRRSRQRGMLFYRLVEQAVEVAPAPYRDMIGGRPL
ncbi:MAG: IS1595 family transposase [Acidimicrobiia bacterium]